MRGPEASEANSAIDGPAKYGNSRYGRALGARLVLVVVALIVFSLTLGTLGSLGSGAGRRLRLIAGTIWAAVTIGLAVTWAVADHAGTGIQVPVSVPSDVIHLTAIATWIGGLVTLVTVVLRRPRIRPERGVIPS